MRIGLYSPYLTDILGGGERHFLTIAHCLSQKHQIEIVLPQASPKLKTNLSQRFNLNLDKVKSVIGPFTPQHSWQQRSNFTKKYDIFYYMTDGSFFIPRAKKNIVHFQIPFQAKPNLIQRLKLQFWQTKTANSSFTKNHLEKHWRIKLDYVHRGCVDTKTIKPAPKQNIIINVGRFISGQAGKHCKRQDFMVKTFKKMYFQGLKDWQLILHGPIEKGRDNQLFAAKVKKLAQDFPIKLYHHSSFNALLKDYGQAKIYWHATGYGINQTKNPQAVEHLGLTTVEAMAAGAVPVVINKGGQPEVVFHAINGLLWDHQSELIKQTLALTSNQSLWRRLSHSAVTRAQDFSQQKFCQLTNKIFKL